jgi:hypothetical protein
MEKNTDFRWEVEKKIVLLKIENRTIQKQFIANYHDENPQALANEICGAYDHFSVVLTRAYVKAEYGAGKLVNILKDEYNINASEKTIIEWLRSMGVEIQTPTRERKRVIRTKWERDAVKKITDLSQKLESTERQYNNVVNELVACESDLRTCKREKESFMRKLSSCREELKETIIKG